MVCRALLGSIATLVLAFPVTARAQAAAESALTNALSSSTTLKAGSALNRALNQSSSRLGTRIQDRTTPAVQVGTKQRGAVSNPNRSSLSAVAGGANSSPARSGISIRGGETSCTSVSPGAQPSPAPGNPGTMSADCREKKSDPGVATSDKYKSFVTLPLPK